MYFCSIADLHTERRQEGNNQLLKIIQKGRHKMYLPLVKISEPAFNWRCNRFN